MARNKLSDLNDHLFVVLERLNEEDLEPECIDAEVKRAKAIAVISSQIINNARVTVDALKIVSRGDITFNELPDSLGLKR